MSGVEKGFSIMKITVTEETTTMETIGILEIIDIGRRKKGYELVCNK